MISPELITERPCSENMTESEAIVMHRSMQFTAYTGYASAFSILGKTRVNSRREDGVLPIDAVEFSRASGQQQFHAASISR